MTDATIPDDALGVILHEVYDGVSVWVLPDGTAVNRWEHDPQLSRRRVAADRWIAAYEYGREREREHHHPPPA